MALHGPRTEATTIARRSDGGWRRMRPMACAWRDGTRAAAWAAAVSARCVTARSRILVDRSTSAGVIAVEGRGIGRGSRAGCFGRDGTGPGSGSGLRVSIGIGGGGGTGRDGVVGSTRRCRGAGCIGSSGSPFSGCGGVGARLRRFLSISRSRTGRRKKIARKMRDSTDMSVLVAAQPWCVTASVRHPRRRPLRWIPSSPNRPGCSSCGSSP